MVPPSGSVPRGGVGSGTQTFTTSNLIISKGINNKLTLTTAVQNKKKT